MGLWDSVDASGEKQRSEKAFLMEIKAENEQEAPKKEPFEGFPTEDEKHFNRFDLRYDAMLLGEISELEDMVSKIDPAKLNKTQRIEYAELVKYLIKNSFYTYLKLSFPASNPLIEGKHIRLLCNILTRAERGEFRDKEGFTKIIITMPPRHLKSRTVSETFPSWFMAKDPTRHVIATSYSADLGVKFGAKNKEKFESLGKDFFGVALSTETKSKSPWETSLGARFLGTGIGGSVTGFGADLLIIDDPFKNRQEADSALIRQNVWNEWEDTLKTRLQGVKMVIVIHTRWHDDDLIGRLLTEDQDKNDWLLVNLPAECENPDVDLLERKKGEPLWPENGYDSTFFDSVRAQKRTFSALYQQRPVIDGGNLFKTVYYKYFDIQGDVLVLFDGLKTRRYRKHECWSFQTIDTALKEKESSDFTGMGHFIITPDFDVLIMDMFNERLEVPKQPEAIVSYRTRWGANFQVVEEKQSGIFLEQAFRKTNIPLRTIGAHKDKVARCFEILTYYERGKVYHYVKMPNLVAFEDQLAKFPNVKHDDMVDVVAHAGKYLSDIEGNSGIWNMNLENKR
jgi:predicted phage terminase large subunit-like protein